MSNKVVENHIKAAVAYLEEHLSGFKVVVVIGHPNEGGGLYYGSSFEQPLDLANFVCGTAWQMAARVALPKEPTHLTPGTLQ